MSMNKVDIKGIDEVVNVLKNKTAKDAVNISRAATNGVASTAKKMVKEELKNHVDSGDLKKSIKSKRLKSRKTKPQSAITVIRQKGWYWKFLDKGTEYISALNFVRKVKQYFNKNMPEIFEESFKKVLIKRIKKNLKAARSKK